MEGYCVKMKKALMINRLLPYVLITGCASALLIRCIYSFCWSDESFYLALVHRLWMGDRPFVDEWSGTQLYSVLLLPVYTLYVSLVGSSDGVYLFFRLLMVFCNYLLSLYIYMTLKKQHGAAAVAGALLFLLYSRANIQGASYYSVSLSGFLLAVFLIYNYRSEKNNFFRLFAAGAALAAVTLAIPYLFLYYLLSGICIVFIKKYKRWRKEFLYVCLGSLFLACLYMMFVLSRITLSQLFEYLPYLFKDPEHKGINILFSLILWAVRIINRYIYTVPFMVFLLGGWILSKWKKKETAKKIKRMIFFSFLLFLINVCLSYDMLGCVDIALAALAGMLYILLPGERRKNLKKDFQVVFVPGILFSILWHMASNTGLDSMTVGFVVCAVVAPTMVKEAYLMLEEEIGEKSKWTRLLPFAIIVISVMQTGYLRLFSVYRDDEIWKLDTRIEAGPAKNLLTTEEHCRQYMEIYDVITAFCNENESGTIVITELVPWAYLCVDIPCGSPSPCRFWGGLSEQRLRQYYALMPDKMPACILAVDPEYGCFKSSLIQGNEEAKAPNGTGVSSWLLGQAENSGYRKTAVSCGNVYIQP